MRFLLPLLLAVFLIGPRLPVLGVVGDTISLISGIAVACFAFRSFMKSVPLPHELHRYAAALLALVAYSGIIVVFNGRETFYFERSLRVILNFGGGVALAIAALHTWREAAVERVAKIIYWTVTGHGAIVITQFLSPPFRDAVYAYTLPNVDPANLNFRMAGLSNGAGAGTSMVQFLAVFMSPMIWSWTTSVVGRALVILSLLGNIVAFFLTGRTGLLLAIAITPLVALLWYWGQRHDHSTIALRKARAPRWWRTMLASIAAAGVVVVLGGVAMQRVTERALGLDLAVATDRTLRTVFTYRETGMLKDETVADLYQRHLIMPNDFTTFVFGSGTTLRENVDSDIGYVVFLFGLGVIGSSIVIWFYVMILHTSWRYRSKEPGLALLSGALALTMLIAHAKEQFLLTRYYFSVTVLLLTLMLGRPLIPLLSERKRWSRATVDDGDGGDNSLPQTSLT